MIIIKNISSAVLIAMLFVLLGPDQPQWFATLLGITLALWIISKTASEEK